MSYSEINEARGPISYIPGTIDIEMVRNSQPYRAMISKGYVEMPRPKFESTGRLWLFNKERNRGVKFTSFGISRKIESRSEDISGVPIVTTDQMIKAIADINSQLDNNPDALRQTRQYI